MGWEDSHLYTFKIAGEKYADIDLMEGEWDGQDAADTWLSQVITHKDQMFVYRYDLGDDWQHEIRVEKISGAEAGQVVPICLEGSRACPPEDAGGPWGYADYLQALADPENEQHEEMLQWRGAFDPEEFDLKAINRELRRFHGTENDHAR